MRSHRSQAAVSRRAASGAALGAAVRTRRKSLGLDQLTLCDLAGVGPAFLYQLERGKPSVRLDKLLDVLEVLGLELHVRAGSGLLVVDAPLAPGPAPESS